jgi:hypothetical protein
VASLDIWAAVDARPDVVVSEELVAQGRRLVKQSRRLIADLDAALRRGAKPKEQPEPEPRIDLREGQGSKR